MKKRYRLNIETLDSKSATEVVATIGEAADSQGVDWALCNSVVMKMNPIARKTII